MIKKILIGIGVLFLILLAYAAMQPADYVIQREISINAKPEVIFPYLSGTKKNDEWMPWKDSDPSVKATYSGPDDGVGSISSWESTGQMGVGSAEITEVILNQKVIAKITYTKPMAFTQISEFLLIPNGDQTTMRWTVNGQNSFVSRVVCLFMNMDKYVGGEFLKGLNKLKNLVENKN
ncbi:MAG: SRPBCC family protein [Bdellovibrionales bacterium]